MIPIDKAVVARLDKGKMQFEILLDPDNAQSAKDRLKSGKDADIAGILAVDAVFTDSKKGLRASKAELEAGLGVSDILEAAKKILLEGVLHTTSAQRDKETQEKWDRIVSLISMNAIDAQTKNAMPQSTIEDALHKAKFVVNKQKRVEDQLQDAIREIRKIVPLTFHERTIQITNVPPNLAGACRDLCKRLGSVEKETWGMDRSLTATVKVPAGLREELMDRINEITKGKIDLKLLD